MHMCFVTECTQEKYKFDYRGRQEKYNDLRGKCTFCSRANAITFEGPVSSDAGRHFASETLQSYRTKRRQIRGRVSLRVSETDAILGRTDWLHLRKLFSLAWTDATVQIGNGERDGLSGAMCGRPHRGGACRKSSVMITVDLNANELDVSFGRKCFRSPFRFQPRGSLFVFTSRLNMETCAIILAGNETFETLRAELCTSVPSVDRAWSRKALRAPRSHLPILLDPAIPVKRCHIALTCNAYLVL